MVLYLLRAVENGGTMRSNSEAPVLFMSPVSGAVLPLIGRSEERSVASFATPFGILQSIDPSAS